MNDKDWKDVLGFEGVYQVSHCGFVRSLDRIVKNKHGKRKRSGKLLRPTLYHGYPKVQLRRRSTFVHRIVAETFLNKPFSNKPLVVNHIDGNKENNCVENLEWVTQSENVRHAFRIGLANKVNPKRKRKLADTEVLAIYTCKNISQRKIANTFKVSQSVVGYIQRGKTYKKITGNFK